MAGKRGALARSGAGHRGAHAAIRLVRAESMRRLARHKTDALRRRMTAPAVPERIMVADMNVTGGFEREAPASMERLSRPGWQAWVRADTLVLALHGDWSVRNEGPHARTPERLLENSDVRAISFDSSDLGSWDSSLLIFLASLREASAVHRVDFDESGLPAAARRLLALLRTEPQSFAATRPRIGVVERVGEWALARGSDCAALVALVGEAVLRAAPALRGKARTRAGDVLSLVHGTGAAALPMVALVNVLVGAIVAFIGGIQLRRLGAEVYVSNLIGVTEVREMAPLITAIVMSGRTGGAYAAEISAMQGSEEIGALRALGIPIFDYLVLPRLLALGSMMAPLCAYAGALGILGGFAVAVSMINISAGSFAVHLQDAVAGTDIVLGLVKSVAFGGWIALAGCRIGLAAGRSATDVGRAATTAAVSGIVGVIALDALFDVCAEALGI
jgi:phospholipid/cholesterol/gamma-HCH transport system permease protein